MTATVGTVSPTSPSNQLVLSELDNTFGSGAGPQADVLLAGVSVTNGNDVGLSFQSSAIGGLAAGFGMPANFATIVKADGVAISADGVNWTRVKDLSTSPTDYSLSQLNLSTIAAAAGIPLTSNFMLRFHGAFLEALPGQGLAFDDIQLSVLKPVGTPAGVIARAGVATGSLGDLAAFRDGADPAGTYTATLDWGDGSPTATGAVNLVSGKLVVGSAGHTYTTDGTKTFTVTLTDAAAGRSTNVSGTATVTAVLYRFGGFQPPLVEDNTYKLGSVLPIKFGLTDVNGNPVSSLSAIRSLQVRSIDARGHALAPAFDPAGAGGSRLRYDADSHQFVVNWKLTGLTAGRYEILLTLDDGALDTLDLWLA